MNDPLRYSISINHKTADQSKLAKINVEGQNFQLSSSPMQPKEGIQELGKKYIWQFMNLMLGHNQQLILATYKF